MDNINKFKDYILKLADEKALIDSLEFNKESYQYWKYLFELVKSEGYVVDKCNICGSINPELTAKGRVFFEMGGYENEKKEKLKEKATELMKSVAIETLKGVVDHLAIKTVFGN